MALRQAEHPGLWVNSTWHPGDPGTFAVVIGVSLYDHLPGRPGGSPEQLAPESYGLTQLRVSALTAYRFFQWLRDAYAVRDCPLAKCWVLLSPTDDELQLEPEIGANVLRPTFDNCDEAVRRWFWDMRQLARDSAKQSRAFFFFSGHGLEPFPQEQLLLPCDYLRPPGGNVNRALSVCNLHAGLAPVPVPYQFFFTDACRNDSMGPRGVRLEGTPVLNLVANWRSIDERVSAPIFYGSVSGASAYQPNQASGEVSLFGQALLEGLMAKANFHPECDHSSCVVRVSPLATFIRGRISELLLLHQASVRQPVQLGGNAMDEIVTEIPVAAVGTPARPAPTQKGIEEQRFQERTTRRELLELEARRTGAALESMLASPTYNYLPGLFDNSHLRSAWEAAGVVRLEDRQASPARDKCVIHWVEHDRDALTYRMAFSVEDHGSHWLELESNQRAFAFLLPGDGPNKPLYLLELALESSQTADGQAHVRLAHGEARLAPGNEGSLGRAATQWDRFRTASLTDALAAIPERFLQEAVRGERPSLLSALLVGVLLVLARRHDALAPWLQELARQRPGSTDALILYNEHRLQTDRSAGVVVEAADRLLSVQDLASPGLAVVAAYALRQAADLARSDVLGDEKRDRLDALHARFADALRYSHAGDLFCAFSGPRDVMRPELVLASQPPLTTESAPGFSLARFVEQTFQTVIGSVRKTLQMIDYRLEPAVLGTKRPATDPFGIHATQVGVLPEASWAAIRPYSGKALAIQWLSDDGPPVPVQAVDIIPDGKRWRVTVHARGIPTDPRWHGFYLLAEGETLTTDTRRELVFLRKPPRMDLADQPHPVELVEYGLLADAWQVAIQRAFTEAQMYALLALIWPKMRLLLEEIDVVDEDVQIDLARLKKDLDVRQQGVREWCEQQQDH